MDCRDVLVWTVAGLLVGCSDDGTVLAGGSSGGAATAGLDSGAPDPSGGGSDDTAPGDPTAGGSSSGDAATSGNGATSSDPGGGSSGSGDGDTEGPAPLWQPSPGTTWQWQLVGDIDTSIDVEVYDIDLFDAPQAVIDTLHADGRVVVCYFSAGSYEEWRDDAGDFPAEAIGQPLDGWPGEAWLDHRVQGVRDVMTARLDVAVSKGCDAVEPDNVDGYTNTTGFDLTGDDQLDYNRWLATEAHARGLSIGLKNDVDQIDALVDDFDWALNEECVVYSECETTTPFIDQGKAVFHVEYVDDVAEGPAAADTVCPQTAPLEFSTLIKEWDLTVWRLACP